MNRKCYAIFLIAGDATRWGSGDKCLGLIHGVPAVLYALKAFQESSIFQRYLFVYKNKEQRHILASSCKHYFPHESIDFVEGGPGRRLSVLCALEWINKMDPHFDGFIFIHDGARPLVTCDNLQNLYHLLPYSNDILPIQQKLLSNNEFPNRNCPYGISLAHRVTETLVVESVPNTNFDYLTNTNSQRIIHFSNRRIYPDRDTSWALETPQVFPFRQLLEDHRRFADALKKGNSLPKVTDDTSIFSGSLLLLENLTPNNKLTHREDLPFVTSYLREASKKFTQ